MQAFYCDQFELPLPEGHRFPVAKYRKLRARVASELRLVRLREPPPADNATLALVHETGYIARVVDGRLSPSEVRAIGFPWSPALVERSRRSVGGTLAACAAAREQSVAINLAGGTHHAFAGHGQGYCVFNDVAVAARLVQAQAGRRLPVAIIDLDVHQGNGTAAVFSGDDSVFTLSLHGASNFPFRKEASDLDVALPDGTDDAVYLAALDTALEQLRARFAPEFVLYVAGADAHEGDRLGRLALTTEGMAQRDERVFAWARALGVPIAVTMAGGYGYDIAATVEVHLSTVRAALKHWQIRGCGAR